MSTKSYRLESTAALGRWLQVALGAQAMVIVITGVLTFVRLRTHTFSIRFDAHGDPVLPATGFPAFGALELWPLAALSGALGGGTLVMWLIWQHRATANLWAWRLPDLRITPGWAVGWWFIPFANLAMPFVAVRELDRRSRPDGGPRQSGVLLGAWWAAFLIGRNPAAIAPLAGFWAFFAAAFSRSGVEGTARTVDLTPTLREVAPWVLSSELVYAAAAILAILVVRRIDRAQSAFIAEALIPPPRPDVVPV